ncbi:hypothetical protein [Stenotrophomonas sp.]|uniref:hypothetical protein n=1 Tax=Stenotrophomonas sp. TaxID=69392 RepID=UPI0019960D5E|nr:hypothetical protein [Stenotrophomonas sp.]MBD3827048.1 hypothetical protein [Stenotrophomonas sp.]
MAGLYRGKHGNGQQAGPAKQFGPVYQHRGERTQRLQQPGEGQAGGMPCNQQADEHQAGTPAVMQVVEAEGVGQHHADQPGQQQRFGSALDKRQGAACPERCRQGGRIGRQRHPRRVPLPQ